MFYLLSQEQAALQFGCSPDELLGVELEDGGGSGTVMSHWETRIMGVSIRKHRPIFSNSLFIIMPYPRTPH